MEDYRLALLLEEEFKYEKQKLQFSDFNLAQQLQKEFDDENSIKFEKTEKDSNNENCKSLVDPSWEVIDPTPNIFHLFTEFNKQFFWSKLGAVSVEWSKRMTSCAGICYYHPRGGRCNITLSEPLLKLRPRSDLVETLLHEMIHAFLFVTHNNRDRDGHGPEFHKHMYRINHQAGTKISVYHSFHDEVRLYKTHWWRCNGPCQKKPPFYGMVKRAMNRAPGPHDLWYSDHLQSCGGTFIKIREPEKKPKAEKSKPNNPKTKEPPAGLTNITNYFPLVKTGTNDKTVHEPAKAIENFINIENPNLTTCSSIDLFAGTGRILQGSTNKLKSTSDDYSNVRNHWLHKFDNSGAKRKKLNAENDTLISPKRMCPLCSKEMDLTLLETHVNTCINGEFVECDICEEIICSSQWAYHRTTCSLSNSKKLSSSKFKECPICDSKIDVKMYDKHLASCALRAFDGLDAQLDEIKENKTDTADTIICSLCNSKILKFNYNQHFYNCVPDEVFLKDLPLSGEIKSASVFCTNESELKSEMLMSHDDKFKIIGDFDLQDEAKCPICGEIFSLDLIENHANTCLDN